MLGVRSRKDVSPMAGFQAAVLSQSNLNLHRIGGNTLKLIKFRELVDSTKCFSDKKFRISSEWRSPVRDVEVASSNPVIPISKKETGSVCGACPLFRDPAFLQSRPTLRPHRRLNPEPSFRGVLPIRIAKRYAARDTLP